MRSFERTWRLDDPWEGLLTFENMQKELGVGSTEWPPSVGTKRKLRTLVSMLQGSGDGPINKKKRKALVPKLRELYGMRSGTGSCASGSAAGGSRASDPADSGKALCRQCEVCTDEQSWLQVRMKSPCGVCNGNHRTAVCPGLHAHTEACLLKSGEAAQQALQAKYAKLAEANRQSRDGNSGTTALVMAHLPVRDVEFTGLDESDVDVLLAIANCDHDTDASAFAAALTEAFGA